VPYKIYYSNIFCSRWSRRKRSTADWKWPGTDCF